MGSAMCNKQSTLALYKLTKAPLFLQIGGLSNLDLKEKHFSALR